MSEEGKEFVAIILAILLPVVGAIVGAVAIDAHKHTVAFENGYEQRMVVGNSSPIWVKVNYHSCFSLRESGTEGSGVGP